MAEPQTIGVIGGGIIGVSCALMLALEGYKVTIIDQGSIGHGCSWGNGAQYNVGASFPMAHPGVTWTALRWLADTDGPVHLAPRELTRNLPWLTNFLATSRRQVWEKAYAALYAINSPCVMLYREMLGDAAWNRLFRPNGALHVWRDLSSGTLDEITDSLRTKHNVAFQRLDAEQIRELEPGLSHDYRRGLFFPGSGSVSSSLGLVEGLMERARTLGVTTRTARVKAIEPGTDAVALHTTSGTTRYTKVIIAAGIGSRVLARSLGVSLSLASERGYHVTFRGLCNAIGRPVTDAASAFVATPVDEGLRIVGIAEFDAADAPPNRIQCEKLMVCARTMLPDIPVTDVSEWMGVRPSTPDSLPIIAAHPKHSAILFATGHGHMGISGAPMTAALICDLAAGRAPRVPVAPYRIR